MFKLTKNEQKVLKNLSKIKQGNLVSLTQASGLSRSATSYILHKLERSGITTCRRVGRESLWSLVTKPQFEEHILNSAEKTSNKFFGPFRSFLKDFEVQYGKRGIDRACKQIIALGKTHRVYSIEGGKSNYSSVTVMGEKYFDDYYRECKKHKIIFEGVAGRGALSCVKKTSTFHLRSILGRLSIVHIVPDEYIPCDTEIIIVGGKIFILYSEKEMVFTIKSLSIADTFIGSIKFMKEHAQKIDLNAFIREEIERREKSKLVK